MININDYSNLKFIFLLLAVLILLLIARNFLIRRIYKQELEIANEIFIGNEEIQEDYLEVVNKSNGTMAVLADGLGKNEAGRISSIVAVKTISKLFKEEGNKEKITYFFKKAFNKASREIIKRVEKDKGGASVLSVIIYDNLLSYALVGDVMLAIFRNKELVKLSNGHSISEVAKKQYYNGKIQKDQALYALKEKKLLYYIGQESFRDIEISETPIEIQKNDIIILMSRGVYEGLRWIEIERILGNKKANINEICGQIMENVKDNNKNNCNGSIMLMKYCGKK
ncbi:MULTISPECIES: PP2C family protein-serine/threonine phosphatase [Clostridium]|jgi:serine/threonine protein phosphatase PrpC|uniref:Protein phosphatase 2C domain-containing protein n=2 Tax=Clostridium beijerinckii TaxID=1520 RepID=A0AAE2V127_CLOBE|nr:MULTISPECIES: protein phosphatase 2C domain-containing protein [Clostridium]ABR36510.1 protein phosphatase 2C domain protein [Clostridium beijerinckii NCIMB 8052]AIU04077.1 protein phosphatase 2C domain-containing protein [Clostridium beijerinckii ATCC 35702]MBF7808842.1 protein phosphatase 2C domain-containing protein [Clostridium beijerinckii]NOW89324.1 serine/threonine protein phosphatase PrpC [Clostridium beijerinckii]NRT22421.1 serine/threonine protein phosphatase PrpC [Clostridium bei